MPNNTILMQADEIKRYRKALVALLRCELPGSWWKIVTDALNPPKPEPKPKSTQLERLREKVKGRIDVTERHNPAASGWKRGRLEAYENVLSDLHKLTKESTNDPTLS